MKTGMTLEEFNGSWLPARYRVFCLVVPTAKNKLTQTLRISVANVETMEEAREAIAKDLRAMRNTYGGLMDAPGTSGRHYRIFEMAQMRAVD